MTEDLADLGPDPTLLLVDNDEPFLKRLAKAMESISSGKRLSDGLRDVPCFDRAALQLVAAGEDSNRLPDMLRYIGASEERSAERSIERFMTILTPLLTVAIGLLVGGIVMSVMQAILAVNEIAAR